LKIIGVLGVTHLLSWTAFSYAGYPRPLQEGIGAYSPLHPAGRSSHPIAGGPLRGGFRGRHRAV